MSLLLYNIFLSLYAFAVSIYALFDAKAKKWVRGRENWEKELNAALVPGEKRIWIHCSSVGEFEQARPLIEALREKYTGHKILVTFFSPSGYEACRNNKLIDYIFYLPHDSRNNAKKFVAAVDPSLAMFIKYEFWYYYLARLKKQGIPALLVSGAFREGQGFFKWYGGLFRKMLGNFSFFFLQDERSGLLLNSVGIHNNIVLSGDTRYDRVSVIAQNVAAIPAVEKFKGENKVLIAGSTWPDDENMVKGGIGLLPANWKLIIAPHEINADHINKLQQLFYNETILFSDLDAENTGHDKKILIINNIGMLSRLFAYGDIAFIGGGFRKGGIHNILEPAVFGLPVIFGPVYQKFVEAVQLVSLHYVFPVSNLQESNAALEKLVNDEGYRTQISNSLKAFMQQHTGATKTIMDIIAREKWLN